MIWFNFMTLLILSKNYALISKSLFKTVMFTSLSVWVATFIYYLILGKYKVIIKELDKEDTTIKKRKTILITIYSLITTVVYFYVAGPLKII